MARNLEQEARELGAKHGRSAGSWVFDGNTDESTIRHVLQMIEDGDPEWEIPAPLSGEWADDPTAGSILEALEVEDDGLGRYDYLLDEYEASYYEAFEDEVIRSGHAMLPEDEDR